MKVTLIEFGKETESGRTYLRHQCETPKQTYCSLEHLVDKHGMAILNPPINGNKTCGFAEMSIDDIGIHVEVKPFSDERGKMFDEKMMDGFRLAPLGTGSLNESGEVKDYMLHYVYLKKD